MMDSMLDYLEIGEKEMDSMLDYLEIGEKEMDRLKKRKTKCS
jgi:hypothetical protein